MKTYNFFQNNNSETLRERMLDYAEKSRIIREYDQHAAAVLQLRAVEIRRWLREAESVLASASE